jgi:trigger factor
LGDEFAAEVGPFTSMDELKVDITAQITAEKIESKSREYEQQVLDKLLKESSFKAPSALVNDQLTRMTGELDQNLASSGLNVDKYLELTSKTRSDMEKEMRPEAERRVALAMVLTQVAAQEALKVDETELDQEIKRLRKDYPDPGAQSELDNPATREEVYNHLMASKVIAKLLSYADTSQAPSS